MFRFDAPPPLSLYVHFPWCVRKCPYCDFNSHAARGDIPEQAYVAALLRDLEQELPAVWGRTVHSIFMGGGTPSLFSAAAIGELLSGIRARLALRPNLEITLEANPGTTEQGRFAAYRDAGINRLSLGVQSLQDDKLEALGRIHDSRQALAAVRAARDAGFDNINLDLMFGLPGQTVEQALADLQAAVDLAPEHLSWYQLTLEPNTLFHARPPSLPGDEALWRMQETGQSRLAGSGYTQYEVSAYARGGRQCRHNLNYWRFGDYIGIGAGAHGKITDAPGATIRRRWKKRHPGEYLETAGTPAGIAGQRELDAAEAVFEFALNRLRLNQPFTLAEFEASSGLDRGQIREALHRAGEAGLLRIDGEQVRHTDKGWAFLNELQGCFLPESDGHAGKRVD
jgi:oxygen-independent coproporphyrinogen-3 oxidase